jgi:hypothetical protein
MCPSHLDLQPAVRFWIIRWPESRRDWLKILGDVSSDQLGRLCTDWSLNRHHEHLNNVSEHHNYQLKHLGNMPSTGIQTLRQYSCHAPQPGQVFIPYTLQLPRLPTAFVQRMPISRAEPLLVLRHINIPCIPTYLGHEK